MYKNLYKTRKTLQRRNDLPHTAHVSQDTEPTGVTNGG